MPERIRHQLKPAGALLALLLQFAVCVAHATDEQADTAYPGGIARVDLGPVTAGAEPPTAHFNGRQVLVKKDPDGAHWQAWVGISLATRPGEYRLETGDGSIPFRIADKQYEEQHITIKNKRQVNPAPMDLERIGRERKLMDRAFEHFDRGRQPVLTMQRPAQGPLSSPFGLKRFFNGQARNPHSGIDIAAPKGSPVQAPADATVALVGNYFFNGNTILLDHGHGLISMYCHLDEILVKQGDPVRAGELIGRVGQTGRATGPHLHWSVSLNDARIDPRLLLAPEPADPAR